MFTPQHISRDHDRRTRSTHWFISFLYSSFVFDFKSKLRRQKNRSTSATNIHPNDLFCMHRVPTNYTTNAFFYATKIIIDDAMRYCVAHRTHTMIFQVEKTTARKKEEQKKDHFYWILSSSIFSSRLSFQFFWPLFILYQPIVYVQQE